MRALVKVLVVAAIMLGTAAAASLAGAAQDTLQIGVQSERPPYSFSNTDSELEGFDVDIAWALCSAMRTRCTLVPLDFTSLIPGLQEGQIDAAVASISITDERRQTVDFTQKYYQAANRFVAHPDSLADPLPDDLAGKVIGVKRGTTHDRYLTDRHADGVSIRRYSHSDEIYIDLAMGRLDLALGDNISLTESFLRTELGADFDLVGSALCDSTWFGHGEGVAVRKGEAALLARLNGALRQILDNGTYDEIRAEYFDYPIYDVACDEHSQTTDDEAG